MSLQPGFCTINSVYELMIQRPSNLPVRCNTHTTRISTHFILSFPFRIQISSEQEDENIKILSSMFATIHQEAHTTENTTACQRCHCLFPWVPCSIRHLLPQLRDPVPVVQVLSKSRSQI